MQSRSRVEHGNHQASIHIWMLFRGLRKFLHLAGILPWKICPRVTITSGWIASICRSRYFPQARISSGNGSLLPGGRHLTTLQMNTSFLANPALASRSSSSFPAAPTNGRPCSFSFTPGPSPMNMIFASAGPSPGTEFFREWCKVQFLQMRLRLQWYSGCLELPQFTSARILP